MNLDKVFDFIKDKRGYDYPFLYKLLNDIPLSEDDLNVRGNLDLRDAEITFLPDNLTVGGSLVLTNSNITSLPNNLTVNNFIYASNTSLSDIPNNLKVGNDLLIHGTPLSSKYFKFQILQMIEDKGGSIGGEIYKL